METLDCRSPEGITVGLIDGIIAVARVLQDQDLSHPAVIEALKDLAEDEDVAWLLGYADRQLDTESWRLYH